MNTQTLDKPVRVGIFRTAEAADRVVRRLLEAGFQKEQILVITSDKNKEKLIRRVEPSHVPGEYTPEAVVAGSMVGAAVGGLALTATAFLTGGMSLLIAGPAVIGGGALVGSFTGAMMTRGFEKEAADYYDQAVRRGDILVGVEDESRGKLAEAERVFAEAGADSVPLAEG